MINKSCLRTGTTYCEFSGFLFAFGKCLLLSLHGKLKNELMNGHCALSQLVKASVMSQKWLKCPYFIPSPFLLIIGFLVTKILIAFGRGGTAVLAASFDSQLQFLEKKKRKQKTLKICLLQWIISADSGRLWRAELHPVPDWGCSEAFEMVTELCPGWKKYRWLICKWTWGAV